MPKKSDLSLSIIPALLPLLGETSGFSKAFGFGSLVALGVLLTTYFFRIAAPLFPRRALRLAVILWVGTIFQILSYQMAVTPLWLASFLLLFEEEDVEIRVGFFATGMTALGIFQEILLRCGIKIFQHHAGVFIIIFAFALIRFLQKPVPKIAVQKLGVVLRYYMKTTAEIAAGICGLFIFAEGFRRLLPGFADLVWIAAFLISYGVTQWVRCPESFFLLIYCAWASLAPQPLALAIPNAAAISLGIPLVEFALDGVRFRLAFSPRSQFFSTPAGLLFCAALVALAFSAFMFFPQ